ncbi:MAG: DUF3179 domain-containing protein [Chloroflexi bacterium]|nr:DUF3179 domain-containing protein [Chloroflexota bacterium]
MLLRLPRLSRRAAIALVAGVAIFAVACGSAATGGTTAPNRADVPGELDPTINLISNWRTDFSKHSVDLGDFLSGGPPKDGIPALSGTPVVSVAEANAYAIDREPVIAVNINGDARAYPLGILTRHEIANDVIGGVPVAVTFCPLCNSAIVFNRVLDGVTLDFGVSGVLRNSDLVMFDRQTESWWQQFTGEAIVGELTGSFLGIVPSSIVSWADFRATYPDGQVLSRDTGFGIDYSFNPYVDYDSDESPFLFRGEIDPRLSPIERVAAVELNGDPIAYPFSVLEEIRLVEDTVGGQPIVVFFQPGTASALDDLVIAESRDVGAVGVFVPEAAGQSLTFRLEGDEFFDNETGTRWNILGKGVEGPLAGEELTLVEHGSHFWFAWAAFNPNTRVFEG